MKDWVQPTIIALGLLIIYAFVGTLEVFPK